MSTRKSKIQIIEPDSGKKAKNLATSRSRPETSTVRPSNGAKALLAAVSVKYKIPRAKAHPPAIDRADLTPLAAEVVSPKSAVAKGKKPNEGQGSRQRADSKDKLHPSGPSEHDHPHKLDPAKTLAEMAYLNLPKDSSWSFMQSTAESNEVAPSIVVPTKQCKRTAEELGWLELLPIREQLKNTGAFDEDALLARYYGPHLTHFFENANFTRFQLRWGAAPADSAKRYISRLTAVAGTLRPEQWTLCRTCKGGQLVKDLSKSCKSCNGGGYIVTHSHDEAAAIARKKRLRKTESK